MLGEGFSGVAGAGQGGMVPQYPEFFNQIWHLGSIFFFFLVITITLAGFFFPNAYKNMTLLCSVFCKEQDTDFTVFTSAGVN